jgi:hypothetical protein
VGADQRTAKSQLSGIVAGTQVTAKVRAVLRRLTVKLAVTCAVTEPPHRCSARAVTTVSVAARFGSWPMLAGNGQVLADFRFAKKALKLLLVG